MATNYTCQACLRALRLRTSSSIRNSNITTVQRAVLQSKNFAISSRLYQSAPSSPATTKASTETGWPKQTDEQAPTDPSAKGDLLKDAPTAVKLASQLRKRFTATTETYVAYGVTENLFKTCSAQADYEIQRDSDGEVPKTITGEELGVADGWWYKELGLMPTFNTWAQVTFLHMYILTVRLRLFPEAHAPAWHQHIIDHFFFAAERRMEDQHKISSGGIRGRYLKDLFIQWRGVLAAYDEGLVKGDAVLAGAVWRNVFKGVEDVDAVAVATVVSYLRREIARVGRMSDDLVTAGKVDFGNPGAEKNVVLMKSNLMDKPMAPKY